MDERETDALFGSGSEPDVDFVSERDLQLGNADAPDTVIVRVAAVNREIARPSTDSPTFQPPAFGSHSTAAVIVLTSDASAAGEFPSERDLPASGGGSVLEIVPSETVRSASLTDSVIALVPEVGYATEAHRGSRLSKAHRAGPHHISRRTLVRQQIMTATITGWREATSNRRVSLGLALAAFGIAAIYATVPGQLAGSKHSAAAPMVAESLISRESTAASVQEGAATDGGAAPFARSNSESSLARLASDVASGRERSAIAEEERRSAVTASIAAEPGERLEETLESQTTAARDGLVVARNVPSLTEPAEASGDGGRSTDVVSTTRTPEPQDAELAAVRAANGQPAGVHPTMPPAGDAGDLAPSAPSSNSAIVKAVLARYASAYERLDAGSVKEIWPTVDERALARAFSGLQAQSITFDACDLTIGDAHATASCRGSATYVTGLGKRSNVTQQRQWTFRLERSPERWAIQEIQVR